MPNPFRAAAQRIDRSNRLVAAQTSYYEALVELRYRRSRDGRKYHDDSSIATQYEHALTMRAAIGEEFGKWLESPPES